MVKKDNKNKLYYCEECRMKYRKYNIALKCEEWCRKNKSCNLDIIKYAVKK